MTKQDIVFEAIIYNHEHVKKVKIEFLYVAGPSCTVLEKYEMAFKYCNDPWTYFPIKPNDMILM